MYFFYFLFFDYASLLFACFPGGGGDSGSGGQLFCAGGGAGYSRNTEEPVSVDHLDPLRRLLWWWSEERASSCLLHWRGATRPWSRCGADYSLEQLWFITLRHAVDGAIRLRPAAEICPVIRKSLWFSLLSLRYTALWAKLLSGSTGRWTEAVVKNTEGSETE